MELNSQSLLTISIFSLILSFSVKAHIPSPSPLPSPSPSPAPPLSYFSSTPVASPAPSPAGDGHLTFVLGSIVKKGTSEAESTLDFLTKKAKDPSVSSTEAECFEQCIDNYSAIIDDFKKAQDDVVAGDYYLLSEDLSAVSADIDACQECFKEMVGGDSPIGKFEQSIMAAADGGLDMLQLTS